MTRHDARGRKCAQARVPTLLFALGALVSTPLAAESPFGAGFVDDAAPVILAQESFDDLFETDDADATSAPDASAGDDSDEGAAAAEAPPAEAGAAEADSFDDLFEEPAAQADSAAAATKHPLSSLHFGGFVENQLAYTYTGDDPHYSSFLTRSKMYVSGRFNSRVSWQLGGHLLYNPVFDFETFYPDRVGRDQEIDGWIDETFIDIDANQWEFRVGRQHIIWGETVGLFFADVISALDLRQFVLPDFDLIRIPQWAVRAEYFNGDFHGEFVYIPYMTTDDLGVFGSEFFPIPSALIPPGVSVRFLEDKDPNDPADDFGFGTRASYMKGGWDVSLFYYTSPDKTAAFEREIRLGVAPTVLFRPIHERIHQLGGTLSKELGPFILKAEAIQTMDRLVSVTDLSNPTGLVETDELRYVTGLDWAGFDGYNVNFQFFQTWFQDHHRAMLPDELESGLSVLIRTTSWHPDVTPEILWIRSLNRDEWLLQAKVAWDFATNWRGTLGADIFGGPSTGFFGRYAETDRVYYELRFSF